MAKPLQLLLNLLGDALTTKLDAIISPTAGVPGDGEDVKLVLGVGLTEGGGQVC